jgi:hypothetical protein
MMEPQGCPGSRMMNFENKIENDSDQAIGKIQSQLKQWPKCRCPAAWDY